MYTCKNCGAIYSTDEAVLCVKCGTRKGMGSRFCSYCGTGLPVGAEVCMQCGVPVKGQSSKNKILAGILGIFFGCFGVHNFYLGYTSKAIVQLVLSVVSIMLFCIGIGVFIYYGIAIWGFVEGILILCGTINKDGEGYML